MDDLKVIIASNIIKLRNSAGITQAELGERLNYSDKSVSKWERAESMPDIAVLKQIAELFNVSIDFLVSSHDSWKNPESEKVNNKLSNMLIMITVFGIFTAAFLVFTIFWILDKMFWMIFPYATTVALITWLVLNSVWNKGKRNWLLVFFLVFSIIGNVYLILLKYTSQNPWQLLIVGIPAEIVVILSFLLVRAKKS